MNKLFLVCGVLSFLIGAATPVLGFVNFLISLIFVTPLWPQYNNMGMLLGDIGTGLIVVLDWAIVAATGSLWGIATQKSNPNNHLKSYWVLTGLYWAGVLISWGVILHGNGEALLHLFDPSSYKIDPEENDTYGYLQISTGLLPIGIFWLGLSAHYFKEFLAKNSLLKASVSGQQLDNKGTNL